MEKAKKNELFRTVKYALIAASAGIIQIGTFTLMNEVFRWNYWVCYLVSLVLSVVWNFTFNRKYTFKSASNVPVAMLKVLAYYAVFTPLSTLLENFLTGDSVGWNEYLVTAINMIINFVTEFLYQRFFVFGKTIDTNSVAKKETSKDDRAKDLSFDANLSDNVILDINPSVSATADAPEFALSEVAIAKKKNAEESEKIAKTAHTSDLTATLSKTLPRKCEAVVLPLLNEERHVVTDGVIANGTEPDINKSEVIDGVIPDSGNYKKTNIFDSKK